MSLVSAFATIVLVRVSAVALVVMAVVIARLAWESVGP